MNSENATSEPSCSVENEDSIELEMESATEQVNQANDQEPLTGYALVADMMRRYVRQDDFRDVYQSIDQGSQAWQELPAPVGPTFAWNKHSHYMY